MPREAGVRGGRGRAQERAAGGAGQVPRLRHQGQPHARQEGVGPAASELAGPSRWGLRTPVPWIVTGPATTAALAVPETGVPARTFWVETLGCPKNQVDSDKLVGHARGRRPGRRPTGRGRRPGRRQHLRLHRGGPPGVDRHHPRPRRRRRPGPTWSSPAAWPSATATSWPRPCPRSTPSPASACPSPSAARRSRSRACRPAEPAPPAATSAVGVREGRRGLRPHVRLLRHPVVPGPAAVAARGVDPRRGRRARTRRRSCSSPRTWRPTARTSARRAPSSPWSGRRRPGRPDAAALPLSVRPHRRAGRRHLRHRRALLRPLAAARVQAVAAADAALGRRRPVPAPHRGIRAREPDAAFRSTFIVGYPGETEADHDQLLGFVEDAQLDWAGFFAFSPEDGTYAVALDGQVAPGLVAERLRELSRAAGRDHRRPPRRLVGRTIEVLVDEPGVGRSHREAPEIDGIVTVPGRPPRRRTFATVTVTGAAGPDLEAPRPASTAATLVRAVGAGHAGQRRHLRPAAGRAGAVRPDRRHRRPVGPVRALGRARRAPTGSTATSPAARAPPARARSSTRWPTSSSCSGPCSRWWSRTRSGGCRSRSSPSARSASASTDPGGPAGHLRAGPPVGPR